MMDRIPSIAYLITIGVALTACVAYELPPTPPPTGDRPTFANTVLSVTDGYTLRVLANGARGKIRLTGIDCPESDQPFGSQVTQLTEQLAFGKEVTVQTHGHDKYMRTIGDVTLSDGTNVNHTLVQDGWCWWYRKYAPGDTLLERLETEARGARKGLWADPQPVPPWEWRQLRRSP